MKSAFLVLLLLWNRFLGAIGRSLGLFFGGFSIGWRKGQKDILDTSKYLHYKAQMLRKKHEEDSNESEGD